MPHVLRIFGGKPLAGTIRVQGSKNACLPMLAACLLTRETCRLENVPAITDVAVMLDLMRGLGARANYDRDLGVCEINADGLTGTSPDASLVRKLRGSVVLLGALLGRARTVTMTYPGGDAIGARPLDPHFAIFTALGASVSAGKEIVIDGSRLRGTDATLIESSVTATENAILAAVLTPGTTILRLPAIEPHVQELVAFLIDMGARIRWVDLYRLEIEGVTALRGTTRRITADELEVSGFAALAAATGSTLTIDGINPQYLDAVFLQLAAMGVRFRVNGVRLIVEPPAAPYRSFRIQSGLYPKLGSDHLPPFAVLATQAQGTTLIHDWLYENRLRYIEELRKMGADGSILDPHRATITGPTPLTGAEIVSLDIRAGLTVVIAALVASGESVIAGVEHLDRGYERLEERLHAIGAEITRETKST